MQAKSFLKFHERLSRAMVNRGIKPAKLAKESGVSKGYISQILSGNKGAPSHETLKKFADVLGVLPEDLLFDSPVSETALREDATPYRVKTAPPQSELVESAKQFAGGVESMMREMQKMKKRLDELEQIVKKGC